VDTEADARTISDAALDACDIGALERSPRGPTAST
jgi:hypothetical protein